jgi:hypothetical protein
LWGGIPDEGRPLLFNVPGRPPYLPEIDRLLVVPRGGASLFQPGRRALGALATGPI